MYDCKVNMQYDAQYQNTKCSNFTVIDVMITFAQTQVKYTTKHQKLFCRVLVLVLNRIMDLSSYLPVCFLMCSRMSCAS